MEVEGKKRTARNVALKYYIGYIGYRGAHGARVLACELGRLVRWIYGQGVQFDAKVSAALKGKMLDVAHGYIEPYLYEPALLVLQKADLIEYLKSPRKGIAGELKNSEQGQSQYKDKLFSHTLTILHRSRGGDCSYVLR